MAELEQVDSQRLVRIAGIDLTRRYELIDPNKSPPPYWPR